jgi:hypothetical protein
MPLYKKKESLTSKYISNSKCDLLGRDDMNAKLRLKLKSS